MNCKSFFYNFVTNITNLLNFVTRAFYYNDGSLSTGGIKIKILLFLQIKKHAEDSLKQVFRVFSFYFPFFRRCLCVSYISTADATAAFRDSNCPYMGMRM